MYFSKFPHLENCIKPLYLHQQFEFRHIFLKKHADTTISDRCESWPLISFQKVWNRQCITRQGGNSRIAKKS